ncbi:MAG: hypothetical protein QMD97_03900 [Candidatus Aenigmarchaeota archaeon]|nr:hypothetical protein [Candidatus Aenigmarchaeota archaeon]
MAVPYLVALAAALSPLKGRAEPLAINVDVAPRSAYVAPKGFIPEDRLVVQPSVRASKDDVYGSVWSNINSDRVSEIDYALGYNKKAKSAWFDAAFYLLNFRGLGPRNWMITSRN